MKPAASKRRDGAVRMKEIGEWLRVNGESIYGTRPIATYKHGQVVFTRKAKTAYAIYLTAKDGEPLPEQISFVGLKPVPGSQVRLLGSTELLVWQSDAAGRTAITIPKSIAKAPPCRHAFVLKVEPAR